ncbi:MAG: ATP-dependent zinc metalloprotease FtsH [Candidatus Promineifilaceae bacterium]
MDEQNNSNPRPQIPIWGWILGILAIVLVVQFWTSGQFGGDKLDAKDVAGHIADGNVEELIIQSSNRVNVKLKDKEETVVWNLAPLTKWYEELIDVYGVSETELALITKTTIDNSARNAIGSVVLSLGPILLIIWIFSRGFRQIQGGGGNSIFGFGRSKARNVNEGDRPTVTFDDVAGVDEAKEEVEEIVQFLREPERFIQVGARIPKGVLMVGPPGTGKTLLARAIAGEAGVPFYHISGSEFVEMFVGVGASRVRDLFNKAKENAPSIVFVDEIDAVGRQRGAGMGGGHDEREQTLNQILTEMDGFDKETNIIVIAATNRADVLDPALLRPGRFDRKVIVDRPDIRGREAILRVHARGKPIAKDVEYKDWARLTAGFSGADLENLINEAAIFAARRHGTTVTVTDLQDAFDRIAIGPERKSAVISAQMKELTAYHEAGHAVMSYLLPTAPPVQKITIIPRGRAGGYVLPLPNEDQLPTTEFFADRIAMLLGGRAAEDVFFGQITSGASSDLQQATSTARTMVTQLGMSDALGLPTYGEEQGSPFLGRTFNSRNYSDDTAARIDQEIESILRDNYGRAKQAILDNKERIIKLAEKLIEVETMDRKTFESFMLAT